ncbi:MAG: hypothetical protein GY861_25050 [bacterium]|nr:hypothetical protein [bacterium]
MFIKQPNSNHIINLKMVSFIAKNDVLKRDCSGNLTEEIDYYTIDFTVPAGHPVTWSFNDEKKRDETFNTIVSDIDTVFV